MYRLRQLRQKKITGGRVALGVFAISMATTIASCVFFHQWLWTAVERRFAMHAANIELAVKMRMHAQETKLWAGAGLLRSQVPMTGDVWLQFVDGLSPSHLQKGVKGYGYAGLIGSSEAGRVLAGQTSGQSVDPELGDKLAEKGGQSVNLSQKFTTTRFATSFTDGDAVAVGSDLWSNLAYREAMARARDSGKLAICNAETSSMAGRRNRFTMFVPVYQRGTAADGLAARRQKLQGFVFSPIDGLDFFDGLGVVTAEGIDFEVFDRSSDGLSHRIYGSDQATADKVEMSGLDTIVRQVEMGGKQWTLTFAATQAFVTRAERFLPLLFGVIGMLISLLLYLVTRSLGNEQHRALITARRMSHRLLVEKDRAQASAETEELLREGFEKACRKLQAKNEDLMRFSSIVAHDLRAPLKRIEGFVELLRDDLDADMNETETRDVMTRLQRSSSRMRNMIDSFQNYTKYGNPNFSHFPIRLNVMVQSLLDMKENDLKSAHVSIDIDEQLEIYADTHMIETIFSNLIDNALKFAGSNKAKIRISASELHNGMVEILVSDHGIGIEPRYYNKVFEMFARLHNDDEYQGTGIGLAVCKKIVEDHGGEISVVTMPGAKTSIRFTVASYQPASNCVSEAIAA